jgi:hypothetical protein
LNVGDGYLLTWTVRAVLLVGMHRAGVTRLRGEGDITLQEFTRAFPDSKHWFYRLRTRGQHSTLRAFFASLGYNGRPELFSMFACLLLNREVVVNTEWLQAASCKLRRTMRALQSSHQIDQVPAVCVKTCAMDIIKSTHGICRRPLGVTIWFRHPVATYFSQVASTPGLRNPGVEGNPRPPIAF